MRFSKTHLNTTFACSTLTQTIFSVVSFVKNAFKKIIRRVAVRSVFDLSDVVDYYLPDFYSIVNAVKFGLFKDKCKVPPFVAFVGLRPKLSSL